AKESAPDVLRPIIDQLWDHLEGNPKSIEDLAALRKLAESARETLNDTTPEQEYVAVYNCMDATYLTSAACLENTVDYVVRAWMCCEDVVYQLLRDRLLEGFVGLVEPERSRELQAVIRADPLIVREYEFALRLLHFLSGQVAISPGIGDAVRRIALADR